MMSAVSAAQQSMVGAYNASATKGDEESDYQPVGTLPKNFLGSKYAPELGGQSPLANMKGTNTSIGDVTTFRSNPNAPTNRHPKLAANSNRNYGSTVNWDVVDQ